MREDNQPGINERIIELGVRNLVLKHLSSIKEEAGVENIAGYKDELDRRLMKEFKEKVNTELLNIAEEISELNEES